MELFGWWGCGMGWWVWGRGGRWKGLRGRGGKEILYDEQLSISFKTQAMDPCVL